VDYFFQPVSLEPEKDPIAEMIYWERPNGGVSSMGAQSEMVLPCIIIQYSLDSCSMCCAISFS
jgi:hypothetical protein